MYTVVKFIIEDTIEIIPTCWLLNEDVSVWPPVKTSDVVVMVKKLTPPNPAWKRHAVKVISQAENYEEARKKLVRATLASDSDEVLTTDAESYGRGKRKPCPVILSESEEEESSQSLLSKLPGTSSIRKRTMVIRRNDESDITKKKEHFLSCFSNMPEPPSLEENNSLTLNSSIFQQKAPVVLDASISGSSPTSNRNNNFEQIYKDLFLLKEEQARQGRVLDKILEKLNFKTDFPEQNTLPVIESSFPLNSIEEVGDFEKKLKDNDVQKYLIMRLRRFGGSNYQDHTRRIMRYMLTDNLAENYNWSGNKDKRQFSYLKIANVIIDAVERENNVSRSSIEDVLKSWLRHAKERKSYVKKSKICSYQKNLL